MKINYRKTIFWVTIVYCILTSVLSILRFRAYNDGFVDLGRMEQALWSVIHGGLLVNTFEFGNSSRFIVHFEPILLLLSPLYGIFKSTEFLLVIQSLAIGLAALPLYYICVEELKEEGLAFIFALVYLLYPSIFYINMIDFHPDAFAMLFIFCMFYFLIKKIWGWFWICVFLVLSIREYFGLIIVFLGIYLFFEYKDKNRAIILCVLGGGWFLITYFLIPRLFSQFYLWADKVGPLGEAYFRSSGLLKNVMALLIPLVFLPLFNLKRLLISLPILFGAILAGQFSYANHHVCGVIPFIFLASISSFTRFNSKRAALILLLSVIVANQIYGASPFSIRFYLANDYHYWKNEHNFWRAKHDVLLEQFINLIPDKMSISTSNHIGSHLGRRTYVNYFPYPDNLSRVDYVLVDFKKNTNIPWLMWDKQVEKLEYLKKDKGFILVKEEDGIYLFKNKIEDWRNN